MKILIVANADWGLWNFRMPIARALREQGADVVLVCPEGPYTARLREAGFRVLDWDLRRRSLGPLSEARALWDLMRLYRRERPDIVHHFTIKPNIYGTLAAWLAGSGAARPSRASGRTAPHRPQVINTWTGLGYTFSDALMAKGLRLFLLPLMRMLHRRANVQTVFQTEHDRDTLARMGVVALERTTVIPGSGVDTARFAPGESPLPILPPQVEGTNTQATAGRDPSTASHHWRGDDSARDDKGGAPSPAPLDSSLRWNDGKADETRPVTVVMAARLLWDKGVGEYVEAAKVLRGRGMDVRFMLAGAPDPGNPASLTETEVARLGGSPAPDPDPLDSSPSTSSGQALRWNDEREAVALTGDEAKEAEGEASCQDASPAPPADASPLQETPAHRSPAVEFLGQVEDMPGLLAQADIAVLPSYHEGIPFFLLEAAAAGLPLVSTDIPGCQMIVREGVTGLTVPPRDAGALADAIATLAADPALRARMGAVSREIAVDEFDQQRIVGQYLALYEVIGG